MGCLGSYVSLKKNNEFKTIYQYGKKWHTDCAVVFYKTSQDKRVGFTASKKVGNSVKRNLARRRLKAVFFELQDKLATGTYVFVAKECFESIDYKNMKSSILWSFKRLKCLE